jgi:ABC-type polysaccharide/polyol phosphate transport system ATPase subunit
MTASTDTTKGSREPATASPVDREGNGVAPSRPAIIVEDVCKSFRIPVHRRSTLKERVLHPFARIPKRELPAAQNVSFTVQKGEFFGIVGRNGSGKSTLLKLLTGIYRPDSGEVRIEGRVSPLIELGVGFNTEMAARDNVLVNGTLLGLSPSQALSRFDDMLEFAGLEEFRDLALKNYSSGMLMRLAFSISINVDGDVLLLDEVLAVGDSGFQDKCNEAFRRLKKEGKTIVLVTHSMDAVRRFCDRAMLMEEGRVVEIGDPEDVAELYLDTAATEPGLGPKDSQGERHGDGSVDISAVWVEGEDGNPAKVFKQGGQLTICAEVGFEQEMEEPKFAFVIRAEDGRNVFSKATKRNDVRDLRVASGERIVVRFRFENHLGVGTYEITPCVAHADKSQWADMRKNFAAFSVRGSRWDGGLVDLPHQFAIERESER